MLIAYSTIGIQEMLIKLCLSDTTVYLINKLYQNIPFCIRPLFFSVFKNPSGTGKMTQQIKWVATKLDNLDLILEIHMVEGEN